MFIVILFIFLGIALGYTLRTGLEVGSNRELIAALPTLGVEAMVLSVSATLGSCVLAWALWKCMKGGEKR